MRICPLIAILLVAISLFGDVVYLKNGDRVSGEIVAKSEDQLIVQTTYFGELTLSRSVIESIESSKEGQADADASENGSMDEGVGVVEQDPVADGWLMNAVNWLNPWEGWESRLSLGYVWNSGETRTQDWVLAAQVAQDISDGEIFLKGSWEYGTRKIGDTPEVKTADRYNGQFRYRRHLPKRFFLQNRTQYTKDLIREIDHQLDQSLGIGWHVFETDRFVFSVIPSGTFRYREVQGVPDGWQAMVSIFQELAIRISESGRIVEEASVTWEPHRSNQSDYAFEVKFENRLTEYFSLEIGYQYRFVYTVGIGVDRKTQRLISGLVYTF